MNAIVKRFAPLRFGPGVRGLQAKVARGATLLLLLSMIASAGCRRSEKTATTRPLVVASFFPLYDFARQLGGTNFEVACLVPPGGDPHAAEATPLTARQISRADLVLLLGLGMDGWVEKLATADNRRWIHVTAGMPIRQEAQPSPIGNTVAPTPHGDGTPALSETADPHVWMDPVLARQMVGQIAAEMVRVAPEHRGEVDRNRQRLVAELDQLDRDFQAMSSGLKKRQVVTFHGAFAYLFARYQLETVGVLELFPGNEPSAAYLRHLVDLMRSHRMKVIFAEPQLPDRPAQIIAREIGGRVERLDPCETILPEGPGESYLTRQRRNLETLRRVLTETTGQEP